MLPFQSNGSLVILDGKVVGSKLMSQEFESDKLLHSRPTARPKYLVSCKTASDVSFWSTVLFVFLLLP